MRSIEADTLRRILAVGDEPLAAARLRFSEVDGFRKYVAPLVGKVRCHPSMLPTQASGRWSTTNPPLVNFPDDEKAKDYDLPPLQSVIIPDPGWWWLCGDHDAIEARLASAYSKDTADLAIFAAGQDIHTITACGLFKLPLPANLVDPMADLEWQAKVKWGGKGDRRRHLAKTARYALTYGEDEMAMLTAKGVEKLGLSRAELLDAGKRFLRAKATTHGVWKQKVWAECVATRQSRTFMGRRRMLFGPPDWVKKEGLNHRIQGAVADIMDLNLIDLLSRGGLFHPFGVLVLNAHDGFKIALPDSVKPTDAYRLARPVVERTWNVDGSTINFPMTWYVTLSDGTKKPLFYSPDTILRTEVSEGS